MNADATGPCVLLVDDDETIVAAMRMLLRVSGHRVRTAASADEAYALVAAGLRPRVLVTDFQLGISGANGLDVVRGLRARLGADVPAILTTGDVIDTLAPEVAALPACELLVKPFDPQSFVERVASLLSAG